MAHLPVAVAAGPLEGPFDLGAVEGGQRQHGSAAHRRLVGRGGKDGGKAPLVAESACWALGERQDPVGVEPLIVAAGAHPDPLVREAAVASLGALGDPRGLPAVLAATSDKPAVRRRAVLALAPFDGPEVEAALERARQDRDWQVRQAAEDLLA